MAEYIKIKSKVFTFSSIEKKLEIHLTPNKSITVTSECKVRLPYRGNNGSWLLEDVNGKWHNPNKYIGEKISKMVTQITDTLDYDEFKWQFEKFTN